jgi:hypothetical protein
MDAITNQRPADMQRLFTAQRPCRAEAEEAVRTLIR